MKTLYAIKIGTLFFCFYFCLTTNGYTQLALQPPMGWNSYNCFGDSVLERDVKANAVYMYNHLAKHGWEYVVIDIAWYEPDVRVKNPLFDSIPLAPMDGYGRLLPDKMRFPSSAHGKGFKPLGDYIHSLGLKFGIHIMRGIPRQAVFVKTPVEGAKGITADMIADTTSPCPWFNYMWGLNMAQPGAQEYLNSLFRLYASWGVDFVKIDDLASPYHAAELEGYKKAMEECGRPMVLSLSPGPTPRAQAVHAAANADMWRITADLPDMWWHVREMFDHAKEWEGVAAPGAWPDYDMLQIGKIHKRGFENTRDHYSRLNEDELKTHMTLWCIGRSPLIYGGNLPENRETELALITNDEVLRVNREGKNPRQLYRVDNCVVWVSATADGNWNVALFNLNDEERKISVPLGELGIHAPAAIRDLWARKDLGVYSGEYAQNISPHGATLLRVSHK